MKYISNRNGFLKNHKLKNNKELETNKILEGIGYTYGPENAGPFSNAIPWGDSLLGRMIHNIMRKARIGVGMVGIKREIERLKSAFDAILDSSVTSKLDKETKKEYNKIIIFSFIDNLERSIDNKEDLVIIKNLTKECINTINNYKEFDKKEYLIKQLKDFLDFLEGLKEDKGEGDKGEDNIHYQASISLLKSIVEIEKAIKEKSISGTVKSTEKQQVEVPVKSNVTVENSFFYKNESLPLFENAATASNTNDELLTVKNSLETISNSIKSSGIEKMIPEIEKIISKAESGNKDFKKIVTDIGKQVVRNELTIGKPISFSSLIKEGLYDNDIPKSISLVGKTLLAFKQKHLMNKDLISKLGGASQPIKNFISAYDKIKQLNINQEEIKKESLLNYYQFITEKDDIKPEVIKPVEGIKQDKKDDSVKDPVNMTTSQKIKDYWDKKIDIKSFVMERTEVEKIKSNIDKIEEDDNIAINGIDPIIEIVKCFNRAYKLHTTQVIPTGRTSGRVTNKIFREYTCFGNGTPESAGHSGGPYRNNAIFNQWENAVLNIKGDKKYQKIFRGETILKTEEGKEIKDAGKNLAKFMLDLLNGEDLYKSGAGGYSGAGVTGKQQEFIEKYFNCKTPKESGANGDASYVQKTSESISDINLKFSKKPLKLEKYNELINTFFAASILDEKGEYRQIYFYIQDIDNNYIYLSYCRSFYFFSKYITESGVALKASIGKGDLNANIKLDPMENENQYQIKATKIDITKLILTNGNFILNGNKKIKYITKFYSGKNDTNIKATLSDKEDIFNIQSIYTLVKEENEENSEIIRFKADKIKEDIIRKNGGFPKIKISNDIKECEIK